MTYPYLKNNLQDPKPAPQLSSDATVESSNNHFSVDNTNNTISDGTVELNRGLLLSAIKNDLQKHLKAEWKLLYSDISISSEIEFDNAIA